MKIAEVLLLEAYFDELELAVKDRLAQYLGSDVNEIPTEEFRKSLSLDGFLLSFEELKSALSRLTPLKSEKLKFDFLKFAPSRY